MNHELRRSLTDLADTGAGQVAPPETMIRTSLDRLTARRRRRRPAVVAGATAAAVVLAGSGAWAVQRLVEDRVEDAVVANVPDLIGMPGGGFNPRAYCGAPESSLPEQTATDLTLDHVTEIPETSPSDPNHSRFLGDLLLENGTSTAHGIVRGTYPGYFLLEAGVVVATPAPPTANAPGFGLESTPAGGSTDVRWTLLPCGDDPRADIAPGEYTAYGLAAVQGVKDKESYEILVGGPWLVDVPTIEDPVLATADPDVAAPWCGAVVPDAARTGDGSLAISTDDLPETARTGDLISFGASLTNTSPDQLVGTAQTPVSVVAVRDGVVVGTQHGQIPSTLGTYSLDGFDLRPWDPTESVSMLPSASTTTEVYLWLEACDPAEDGSSVSGSPTRLPAGDYEVWATYDHQINTRTPVAADGTPGEAVAADELVSVVTRVGDITVEPVPVLGEDDAED
ncbi:hypothetical protein [Sanguibacter suaedae]|uniref:Uncharacterized protein n=1 Tax=Sanguibacter suaedae TaxID=2795737 RepID=A0A934I665_9MICO|nr:hypothetical protein [Sanguibacter suaedae]MBI9115998.1 hypothetical protein [Sanguibacter suaedae]